MDVERLKVRFLPMSETMFYILSSLTAERHGYGIMEQVAERTGGRVVLGAGTVYQSLGKLEKAGLIAVAREVDRRKEYRMTPEGWEVLRSEARRICELYDVAKELR